MRGLLPPKFTQVFHSSNLISVVLYFITLKVFCWEFLLNHNEEKLSEFFQK